MKKIATLALMACVLLCALTGLASCGGGECEHSYTENVTPPTCTERGYTTYTCEKCGDSYEGNQVDALSHAYGEETVVTEPTCTESGTVKRVCDTCGDEKTNTISSTGHSFANGFCTVCSATDSNSSVLIDGTEIDNLSITENGILSWAKMKVASKYALEITTSSGKKTVEVKKEDAFVDLATITDFALDYGNNACVITVYEWQSYTEVIDGETVEIAEHVPVGKKSFNVVNLNAGMSVSVLEFKDGIITLDGFKSSYFENDLGKYLLGEVVLEDKDASVYYRIDKQIKLPEGYEIVFYATRQDRDNGENPLTGTALSTRKVKAGNNWFFANAIDADGNVHTYDFLIVGVTYIDLFVAEIERALDANGDYIPTYTYLALENNKVLQNGYININEIYKLIPVGYTLRDNEWNVYERNGDYTVPLTKSLELYYAPTEDVLKEKAEIDAYREWFNLTLYMDGYEGTPDKWILSVHSDVFIPSLVVPYRIIGNEVMLNSSSFYGAMLSKVSIAPGYTSLPGSLFSSVESLSTLNLPATVTSLGDWMFNPKFAETLTVNCESYHGNGRWNQISGSTSYFTTRFNVAGAASTVISDGYTARITADGAYIVSCETGTTAPIPKTVVYGIIEYPVVGLYEGALTNYAGAEFVIDKGIISLYESSFGEAIARISVDGENPMYTAINGILYDKELSRIVFVPYLIEGDITLPESIYSLSNAQFKNRTRLTGINTGNVAVIPKDAFYGCASLARVALPSVVNIGDSAFYGCAAIDSLTISANATSFGSLAFYGTAINTFNYAGTVINWATVTMANMDANPVRYASKCIFAGAELNGAITITGISKINSYVFSDAKITALTLGSEVVEIGDYAFSGSALTSLDLGGNTTKIGNGAFTGTAITSLNLPSTLTSIGDNAFSGARITEITIPAKVTKIGASAFYNCGLVTKLTILASNVTYGKNAFLNTNVTEFCGVTPPEGVDVGKIKVLTPLGATTIVKNQYSKYTSLTEIIIPNTVTKIESEAFASLASLEKVGFEANSTLTSVGYKAFSNCTGLKEITLPEGVTTIGEYAFENCSSLVSFIMPDSVTGFTVYILQNCTSLEVVKFSKNMNECIGPLYGCGNLKKITISGRAVNTYNAPYTHFGALFAKYEWSTYDYEGAVTIEYPYAGNTYKFYVPAGLTKITITGDGTMSSEVFKGMTMVKEIILEDGQTAIPNYAFDGCTLLESIGLGGTITSFGTGSLNGCTALKTIRFAGTKAEWEAVYKPNDVITAIDAGVTVVCSDGEI